MDHDPLRRGLAEFVGTFTLIFAGAGSVIAIAKALAPAMTSAPAIDVYSGLTLVGVALANGLAIAVMVSAVGHISGGHFNPADHARIPHHPSDRPFARRVYWSVQFAAAAAAAALPALALRRRTADHASRCSRPLERRSPSGRAS